MKKIFQRSWPDALVVLCFLLLSFFYFATPIMDGLVLGGHDTVAGMGQGQEQAAHYAATGERTRWTGSIFSGMPTYQIAPTYGSSQVLNGVGRVVGLFTTGPLGYLFMYLFGFYILMRALRFKPLLSAFGAMVWAFSSYFFIIIAAGHLWKVATLGFIPPTIAGLVLAYRGKWLWGALITALFTALQVLSNHLQMTYYFLFPMAFIVLAYGIDALRQRTLPQWCKATAAIVVGGVMGALINLPNLYHTWEYSKESMRGAGELTAKTTAANGNTGGLERDYITQWSYGIDESLTLLIANFKGGGSQSILDREGVEDLEGYSTFYEHAGQLQQALGGGGYLPGTSQYWGEQPMTVGPVYVGAIVCFLFVLGLFWVRGPMKWALLAATVLSFLFAWGKYSPLTDFFIDHLPMYAKFRTPSSALVVAEWSMPLLAMLALAEVLRRPEALLGEKRGRIALGVSLLSTAGVALLFAFAPTTATLLSGQDLQTFQQLQAAGVPADFMAAYRGSIEQMHADILAADAWRSFWLVAFAAGLLFFYVRKPKLLPSWLVVALLMVVSLADMWNVNRRYLNTENFSAPEQRLEGFAKKPADETILRDKDLNYRVLNLSQGNPFNESTNETAYHHKSIGGYHAAKLHRYQDLIDRHLGRECAALSEALGSAQQRILADSLGLVAKGIDTEEELAAEIARTLPTDTLTPVLNMLNAKWLITAGGNIALRNPAAQGHAWYVNRLDFVENADAEMAALNKTDLRHAAVADTRFKAQLDGTPLDSGVVQLTHYAPNELRYTTESERGGVVVFSEIYYPSWTATIDGQAVELGRANYVLRALRIPKGKHEVVLTFRPTSVATTETIAYVALALLALGFGFALWRSRKAE